MNVKPIAAGVCLLLLLAAGCAGPNPARTAPASVVPDRPYGGGRDIAITRSGSQPPQKGSASYFTGDVRVEPLFPAHAPARASGGTVTFQPGARSAWHTHPLGQTLVVTSGVGRVQRWGGPVEEIREGDVVWIPPGVKHWHGAAPTSAMTHVAIQEGENGSVVNWMEQVTEEQYAMSTNTPTTRSTAGPAGSAGITQPHVERRRLSPDDVRQVAPALERYTQERLYGEVWKRPDLSPRDRSIVTISAMVARGQTGALTYYFAQALDHGVKPGEISEIVVHLAYYAGWGNAFAAVGPAKEVFAQRGVGPDQLPAASGDLLPLDEAAEAQRASTVEKTFGAVAPGVVQYTTDALFRDLWLRPGLAPRDRSLVTVSALVATGQVAQITYHLNRAMDNGLTQAQASEAMTQLAFYMGWPNVFSALPVVKEVFEKRSASNK